MKTGTESEAETGKRGGKVYDEAEAVWLRTTRPSLFSS